jgi:hypothetical protein
MNSLDGTSTPRTVSSKAPCAWTIQSCRTDSGAYSGMPTIRSGWASAAYRRAKAGSANRRSLDSRCTAVAGSRSRSRASRASGRSGNRVGSLPVSPTWLVVAGRRSTTAPARSNSQASSTSRGGWEHMMQRWSHCSVSRRLLCRARAFHSTVTREPSRSTPMMSPPGRSRTAEVSSSEAAVTSSGRTTRHTCRVSAGDGVERGNRACRRIIGCPRREAGRGRPDRRGIGAAAG